MTIWQTSPALLAQIEQLNRMKDRFGGAGSKFGLTDGLAIAAIVAAFALAVLLLRRLASGREAPAACNAPSLLFGQLCEAHQLAPDEKELLHFLARCRRLEQPARLFLEPELFEAHGLPGSLANHWTAIQTLRRRLFGIPGRNGQDEAETPLDGVRV